jgi:hypothetical protein
MIKKIDNKNRLIEQNKIGLSQPELTSKTRDLTHKIKITKKKRIELKKTNCKKGHKNT